ncbi:hypothetical protein EBU71_12975, partial [bacterium]|nr:hypothetical protein [Candidatus Elulimicrobium humile]
MAINRILYAPEWSVYATFSIPSSGFKLIYPKQGYTNWFIQDDQGTEKQLGISNYYKNGLSVSSYGTSSLLDKEISVALGRGLTFAGNYQGSTISVFGITTDMVSSSGGATSGYVLSSAGTNFAWVPLTAPGVSGTTNKIPKFATSTTLTDSLLTDDGTQVVLGVTPSFVSASFSNTGNFYNSGKIYLKDSGNLYLQASSGILVQTDQNFVIQDELGYKYLTLTTDNTGLSGSYTFSLLRGTLQVGDYTTGSYFIYTGDVTFNNNTITKRKFYLNGTYLFDDVSSNLALGYDALNGNDLATSSNFNIAIGASALGGLTANSTSNIAIGAGSLLSATTSSHNIAVGYRSLRNNRSDYNIGIGTDTLFSNTTGQYNVGLGYQTLYSNTSGYQNTAIGNLALYANTSAIFNTAIGNQALESNTTGNS